ncbi:hypothetical protein H4N58_18830 [Mumia sp. ZJ1417]|uniref:FlgD immunoglobulin-like domain containing protein n=1 Tax=Mumia sp. ZJ1417 TaxID=2708082 RepID=UPI00141F60EC|nr:FlgD immunoglobulin-like domain containing protein [Mumia sp. ZJ1417]QMW66166.1 hypothetical protein H4N58_18830 [Mumia sp. ZJ1417]
MRRTLVPALAVALLPFTAVSPAHAGVSTPAVITPGKTATLTFTLPEALPSAVVEIRPAGRSEVVSSRPLADLPAGDTSTTWDGRTTGGTAVADGAYTASIRPAIDGSTPLDYATVRTNVTPPRAGVAPSVSAGAVFPWTDGYGDAITLTGPAATSEITATSSLQVLNSAGTVVWSSAARSARWTGRSSAGAILPKGTYRVRSRFLDTDGLTGHSPTRNVTVSAARLVTRKVVEKVEPRRYATGTYTGKCGKVFRPARKGRTWKKSVGLASRHKCGGGKYDGAVEVTFGAWWPTLHDVSSLRLEVVGGGHTRAKRNVAVGYSVKKNRELGKVRRLPARYGTRTMLAATGARARSYVNDRGEFYWGVIAYEGSRYDVKSFRITLTIRQLVDPNARVAGAAGGVQPLG